MILLRWFPRYKGYLSYFVVIQMSKHIGDFLNLRCRQRRILAMGSMRTYYDLKLINFPIYYYNMNFPIIPFHWMARQGQRALGSRRVSLPLPPSVDCQRFICL